MRLTHPEAGKISQGAIFNCVALPGFEEWPCGGVVMTARCDLEHDKQSVVNFLPIIPFRAWVQTEMCYLIAKRLRAEIRGALTKSLLLKGATPQALETFPLAEVIRVYAGPKDQKKLDEQKAKLDFADRVFALGRSKCDESAHLIYLGSKHRDSLVADLIKQKLGEFYFLESTDVTIAAPIQGSVILLRQMQTIRTELATKIANGAYDETMDAQSVPQEITFRHEPACMVTGVLRSPDIEHLAQSFSFLFTRIGLADQSDSTIEDHIALTNAQ